MALALRSTSARVPGLRLRLAPELPSVKALGLHDPNALLEDPLPQDRAERLVSDGGFERWRFPLPGTPLAPGGPMTERPQGAGTGWVRLERWRGGTWRTRWSARFSAPRSASLAERHWNLLCLLRAHGIGTQEPWAVGAVEGGLFAPASFLVTREFETPTRRLSDLLGGDEELDLGLLASAMAATFRALETARLVLPRLGPRNVWVQFGDHAHDEGDCGLQQIATWREDRALGGLARDPRPAILLADVRGGRVRTRGVEPSVSRAVERLDLGLTGLEPAARDRGKELVDRLRRG